MDGDAAVREFQEVLDRVARTGTEEEVDVSRVPDVRSWERLESRGCVVCVRGGRWWVVPQAA